MKNILKNFDRIGLVVLLAAFFVTVGFKATEKMNAPTWYEVEIRTNGEPTEAEDQLIIGTYPGGTPVGNCAAEEEELPICAVELSGNLPVAFPLTMAQAKADNSIDIGESKHLDED